jgi:hypothetical protein
LPQLAPRLAPLQPLEQPAPAVHRQHGALVGELGVHRQEVADPLALEVQAVAVQRHHQRVLRPQPAQQQVELLEDLALLRLEAAVGVLVVQEDDVALRETGGEEGQAKLFQLGDGAGQLLELAGGVVLARHQEGELLPFAGRRRRRGRPGKQQPARHQHQPLE